MTDTQKTVLFLLIGIAVFELALTKRFGDLWTLAFNPSASGAGRDQEGGGIIPGGEGIKPGHNP